MVRGPKKKKKVIEYSDPQSLKAYKAEYVEWMKMNNYSWHTRKNVGNCLTIFISWCEERGITQAVEVNQAVTERYRKAIYHYRKANNQPLSMKTQSHRLSAIRVFFKWLAKRNYILFNPASELELPRSEKRLPSNVLSQQEIEQVINQPDSQDELGVRDRAILETFYSTGIRRSELMNLKLYDLSMERGTLLVRQGKGKKDRVVPIGQRAIAWIDKYLLEVRPDFVMEPDHGYLFITLDGDPFSRNGLGDRVRHYVKQAELGKIGSCHLFRHAMATHMLENGADVRIIQAILGHENLSTTEKYTHVAIDHIKAVHNETHPAKLNRTKKSESAEEAKTEQEALLSSLVAENDEDD